MNEPSAIPTFERRAREHRITKETDVLIDLSLDGTGSADVATGVPFLDHMPVSYTHLTLPTITRV